jgi:hypothetical protein
MFEVMCIPRNLMLLTYSIIKNQRQTPCSILNITCNDDDDDGNAEVSNCRCLRFTT